MRRSILDLTDKNKPHQEDLIVPFWDGFIEISIITGIILRNA
jgi:hypothetical protein